MEEDEGFMEPKFVKTIDFKTRYVTIPNAKVWLSQYQSNGGWALMITDEDYYDEIIATVNLEGYNETPGENNVFIKDWSENEGVLRALILGGVVGGSIRSVPAGWTQAEECELLFDAQAVWEGAPAF